MVDHEGFRLRTSHWRWFMVSQHLDGCARGAVRAPSRVALPVTGLFGTFWILRFLAASNNSPYKHPKAERRIDDILIPLPVHEPLPLELLEPFQLHLPNELRFPHIFDLSALPFWDPVACQP